MHRFLSFLAFRPSWARLLTALLLLYLTFAFACQANVDLFSEKARLQHIEGTSRCEADRRLSKGRQGSHSMRLFLVADNLEAIPPGRLQGSLSTFAIDNLYIAGSTKDPKAAEETLSPRPQVFDAETGKLVSTATATLDIAQDGESWIQENPNYTSVKERVENLRVSKSVALLVDMSQAAGNADTSLTRTSTPAGWILSNFNQETFRGDLDVFAILFMRGGVIQRDDNLFINKSEDEQTPSFLGKLRGFLQTSSDNKDEISKRFTSISAGEARGTLPLYEGLNEAAVILREMSWDPDGGLIHNNPAAISISITRDANLIDNKPTRLSQAETSLRGTQDQFVPLMSIVYPRASTAAKQPDWDKHLDELCQLARAASLSENRAKYFGHVFPMYARNLENIEFQRVLRSQLDGAYNAMEGYLEVKINFQLGGSGLTAGKRYIVAFSLKGEFLGERVEDRTKNPILFFEVEAN